MVADTTENLHDLGTVWLRWGGVWSPSDEVHFEFPGFSVARAEQGLPEETCSTWKKRIAQFADLIIGFVPGIGEGELGAELLKFGFPKSQVLQFLSSPAEFYACGRS